MDAAWKSAAIPKELKSEPAEEPAEAKQPSPRYDFFGGNDALYRSREREVLCYGAAGTGKTLAALVKLFNYAKKYHHARCLIVAKTRKRLTQSVLVTLERDVLGQFHECLSRGGSRETRESYKLENGSEIVLGGMDDSEKVLSQEWDMIFVSEAVSLTLDNWEALGSRLRAGVADYDQLIGDCNPVSPRHWLYQRCTKDRKTRMIHSRHEDNPRYWDRHNQCWTPEGERYVIQRLGDLTGPRAVRFREGRWEMPEGLVWSGYDEETHLIDPFPIPHDWPRYLSIDFGHTVPFSCLWFATDPDGRAYMYREIYRTKTLIEEHAAAMRPHIESEPPPRAIISDPAGAQERATLAKHLGIETVAARKKTRTSGIEQIAARLKPVPTDPQKRPRLFFFRDVVEGGPEPDLQRAGKPTCLADEIVGYVWNPKKDEPVDKDNHAMDALRYFGEYIDPDEPEMTLQSFGERPPTYRSKVYAGDPRKQHW